MSIEYMTAAFKADIASSSEKFVLVALSDYANEAGHAYPSIQTLSNKTSLNRKTIIKCLECLKRSKIITDTGERKGRTQSVKVYAISLVNLQSISQRLPKTAPFKKPKKKPSSSPKIGTSTPLKQSRSSPKNGTSSSPKIGTSTPLKQSQFRDTEPSVNYNRQKEPPVLQLTNDPAANNKKITVQKQPAPTTKTWAAYSAAYRHRYGVDPTRNAKVNGMLKNFIQRVPICEAPDIASFFVEHPNGYYVSRGHSISCLLNDAEKIRTEWLTNTKMTAREARQADSLGGAVELAKKLHNWNGVRENYG